MANKIHPAEKGRNLEEEAQVVVPAVTPAPATAPVNQADLAAQTYVDDGNGNIVPGPGVGVPVQEQPVVTQPATEAQATSANNPAVATPQTEQPTTASQPAAVVVQNANGQPTTTEQPAKTVVSDNGQGVTDPVATQVTNEQVPIQGGLIETPADNVQQRTTTPYLYDWSSGMSFNDAYKQNKHNAREIMDDQRRWAQENGKPLNVYDWATYLDHDADKTKEQNEAEIKKAEKKKKWDALGTFLTHLGNAVGAAGWGGSVKLEDPVKLSERQREIFEKTQALRRQRNKEMMDAYMKQYNTERQARLDETRNRNEQRRLDQRDEDIRIRSRAQEWKEQNDQGKLDYNKEKLRLDNAYRDRKMSLEEYKASISALNAATASFNAHATTTSVTTDANGNQKTTVRSKGTSGNGGKGKTKSAFGSRTSGKSAFGKRQSSSI